MTTDILELKRLYEEEKKSVSQLSRLSKIPEWTLRKRLTEAEWRDANGQGRGCSCDAGDPPENHCREQAPKG